MQPQRQPSGLRFLENLAYLVPGYAGYRQRSRRREEDALLRARVTREVRQLILLLDALQGQWSDGAGEALREQLFHRRLRLEAISEAVRCTPYRARRFFEAELVPDSGIEQLLEADLLVLEDLAEALSAIEACLAGAGVPRDLATFFQPFDERCARLEGHLIMREKTLATL